MKILTYFLLAFICFSVLIHHPTSISGNSGQVKGLSNQDYCELNDNFDKCLEALPILLHSTRPKPKDDSKVLIVGDSIAVPDSFRLVDFDYEKLAGNGRQSSFFLNAITIDAPFNFTRKLENTHYDIVFVAIGSNDASEMSDLDNVSFYDLVYSNLENYIKISLKNNSYPILSTIAFGRNRAQIHAEKERLVNKIILNLSSTYDVAVFNYFKLVYSKEESFVFKDFVHPTDDFNHLRSDVLNNELKNL